MRFTKQLLPVQRGNIGVIVLNNPKPLHALTLEMSYALRDVLSEWYAQEKSVKAVLLKADNNTKVPTFCAGGDVKAVAQAGADTTVVHGQGVRHVPTADFFRHEYIVNHMLGTATTPQISLWNGLVMGGGVGLSIHGKYRVATEQAVFAMPETKIGLFPDVGSMYWMNQLLSPPTALYLALTGTRLKAPDLVWSGLATHYVPAAKLDELENTLMKASLDDDFSVQPVLDSFHEQPDGDIHLQSHQSEIERHFSYDRTVEDMMARLRQSDSAFAQSCHDELCQMSPTSLKVTLEGLRRGASQANLASDLHMEYRMSQGFMRGHDFYEGIRAALIDKDGKPKWQPARLEDVTEEMVENYFAPIAHEWKLPTIAKL